MSGFKPHLVKIEEVKHHENADSLDLVSVYGHTVVTRKGNLAPGDLAVWFPIDAIIPMDPEHPTVKATELPPGHVVEAKRLRGIFSHGLVINATKLFSSEQLAVLNVGDDVRELLGITKWEPGIDKLSTGGENEHDLGYMPTYTDMESWWRYRHKGIINLGEEVIVTEKLHGCNGRISYRNDRLWVGSRTCIKRECVVEDTEKNLWWKVAKEMKLEERFKALVSLFPRYEKTVLYGEVFGQVQKGFEYSIPKGGASFKVFDTFCGEQGKYNDWDETKAIVDIMGLETVPELFRGPWSEDLESLRFGKETVSGKESHFREGFVIKPAKERWQDRVGRVIFKMVSEDYLMHTSKKKK